LLVVGFGAADKNIAGSGEYIELSKPEVADLVAFEHGIEIFR
tara:strand:+ start:1215 stop:1340 length:126 start_codon:yes stop_codon:yes gene_type:complete